MSRTLLRTLARLDGHAPDPILIERSLAGDPEGFVRLVARHGPMVFSIAKRILGNGADAEDVFQATFLVLFRRRRAIRQPENLAGWLFGVAHRTASDLRRSRARRANRLKELIVARPTPNGDARPDPDLPWVMQRELAALPDHYRVPIALCDLDGRSRSEVALLLKIPEGTLSSRLTTGRKRLAKRLVKLGYGGAVFGAMSEARGAPILPNFDPAEPIPPAVQTLANGAMSMLSFKTPVLAWILAAGCAAILAGTALVSSAQGPAGPGKPAAQSGTPFTGTEPADAPDDRKVAEARPVVVKTIPEAGAEGVDPGLKEIRVTFSKKMADETWSWASDKRYGADVTGEKPAFDKDGRTCIRAVTLKPNTTYAIWINTDKFDNFRDAANRPAVPYLWVFRTGAAQAK